MSYDMVSEEAGEQAESTCGVRFEDAQEGFLAFAQKAKPEWKGRIRTG